MGPQGTHAHAHAHAHTHAHAHAHAHTHTHTHTHAQPTKAAGGAAPGGQQTSQFLKKKEPKSSNFTENIRKKIKKFNKSTN